MTNSGVIVDLPKRALQRVLAKSSYSASRGGHAPGFLRDAFLEALELYYNWNSGEPEPQVEVSDATVPISAVWNVLWNCHDILPTVWWSMLCDCGADDPETGMKRRTYGAAARWLKQQVAI